MPTESGPAAGWTVGVRWNDRDMSDYNTAWDSLAETIGAAKGQSSGSITDLEHLTTDQRLKVIEIAALLSISQELSSIHHAGINPEYDSRG